jgi:hypothetical protein
MKGRRPPTESAKILDPEAPFHAEPGRPFAPPHIAAQAAPARIQESLAFAQPHQACPQPVEVNVIAQRGQVRAHSAGRKGGGLTQVPSLTSRSKPQGCRHSKRANSHQAVPWEPRGLRSGRGLGSARAAASSVTREGAGGRRRAALSRGAMPARLGHATHPRRNAATLNGSAGG